MLLKTYEWGDPSNPPLICVHGVGVAHGIFRRAAEEHWGRYFRVIAVDLRGHGHSGWEPPWTHETYVDDLIETLDALGIGAAHWVGFSFGGRLVLQLIAKHDHRVLRAAVLEPVIQINPGRALSRAMDELTNGTWDSMEAFVASRGNIGKVDVDQYVASIRENMTTLPDGRVQRRTCQPAIVSIFSEFAIPAPPPETITVPTLLLYAPAWDAVTPEQRTAYEPYVDEVVEVPGLHAVLTSAFDETTAAVSRFLTTAAS